MAINDNTSKSVIEENKDNVEIEALVANTQATYELARLMPAPRFIKTHFALSLVPELLKSNCKVSILKIS